jgi:hypothetical protein
MEDGVSSNSDDTHVSGPASGGGWGPVQSVGGGGFGSGPGGWYGPVGALAGGLLGLSFGGPYGAVMGGRAGYSLAKALNDHLGGPSSGPSLPSLGGGSSFSLGNLGLSGGSGAGFSGSAGNQGGGTGGTIGNQFSSALSGSSAQLAGVPPALIQRALDAGRHANVNYNGFSISNAIFGHGGLMNPGGGGGQTDWQKLTDYKANFNPTSLIPDIGGEGYLSGNVHDATAALDNMLKRGQITQQAYNAGLGNINTQRTGATDSANSLASGILTTERSKLSDELNTAYQTASDMPHNLKNYHGFDDLLSSINNEASTFNKGAGDQIKSAISGAGYITLPQVIQAAGQSQGAFNNPGSNLLAALGNPATRTVNPNLGNQGVF